MLFKEINAVYSENHGETNKLCGKNADLLVIKVGGTDSYHWPVKG
jgi:hypothetical protein